MTSPPMTRIQLISSILAYIEKMPEEELRQFVFEVRQEELQLASTTALQRELQILRERHGDAP